MSVQHQPKAAELLAHVDRQADEITKTLTELMAIPAFGTTGTGYAEVASFLARKLMEAGLNVETIEVPAEYLQRLWGTDLRKTLDYIPVTKWVGRTIVFGRRDGRRPEAPSLHLTQHYDEPGFLETAPGGVSVADGHVRAAGVSLCRAGIASILAAAKAIASTSLDLAGTLYVSFTPDNHTGGEGGAGYLVERNIGKSPFVITASAGGADTVVLGYKGALWLKITTRGVSAPASDPHLGVSAIDQMTKIQNALSEVERKMSGRVSRWPISPLQAARYTMVRSRISSPGGIRVPESCTMFIDVRIPPEGTVAGVIEEIMVPIRQLQGSDKDLVVEVETVHAVEPAALDPSSRLATVLASNVRKVRGAEPRSAVHTYYTEFRFFPQHWKSQTANYSPGPYDEVGGSRSSTEEVLVEDVVSAAKVLTLTAQELLTS